MRGNIANMCATGIRHNNRSSNACCKEKLWRGQQWMPAVSGRRQMSLTNSTENSVFFAKTFFGHWNISVICLTVVLKLTITVFFSLHFFRHSDRNDLFFGSGYRTAQGSSYLKPQLWRITLIRPAPVIWQ